MVTVTGFEILACGGHFICVDFSDGSSTVINMDKALENVAHSAQILEPEVWPNVKVEDGYLIWAGCMIVSTDLLYANGHGLEVPWSEADVVRNIQTVASRNEAFNKSLPVSNKTLGWRNWQPRLIQTEVVERS